MAAGSRLVEAVLALPRASEEGDREQIDGLIRLARQLQVGQLPLASQSLSLDFADTCLGITQSVVGPETSGIPVPPGVADRTMGSIAEAAALLRWLGVEIGQLPAQQQMEAAMIPAILAQKVSPHPLQLCAGMQRLSFVVFLPSPGTCCCHASFRHVIQNPRDANGRSCLAVQGQINLEWLLLLLAFRCPL